MPLPSPRSRKALPALLASGALFLGACSAATGAEETPQQVAGPPAATVAAEGVRVVDPAAAAELLAATPAPILVDVRTPQEFAEGHLDGATLVDLNAPDFADRIASLDRDASYVIYCRSGNRSAAAREVMAELGFTDVADIRGGIQAWSAAGLPVTG